MLFQEIEYLSGDVVSRVAKFLVKDLVRSGCPEALKAIDMPLLGSEHQRIETTGEAGSQTEANASFRKDAIAVCLVLKHEQTN